MSEELKPCPFCGGSPYSLASGRIILCNNCFVETDLHHNEAEAIAAWNRRAPDPKVAALVEAERKRCYDIVMAARLSEIDTDLRTILHFIAGGRTIEEIKVAQEG